MEWTTHALSGVATGYLITNDWKGAVAGGVASVIPDLDEPRSKFGKPFFFISIPLNKLVGHRTLTHSMLFALSIGLIGLIVFDFQIATALFVGLLAHIVGDMITGKVQLLFPLQTKVGLKVSRINYILIDRIVRVALLIFVALTIYKDVTMMI